MKKFKAAIFDMDGTLLDTMYIWRNLSKEYLKCNNIPIPPEIEGKMTTMGLVKAIDFLKENFHLNIENAELREGLLAVLENYYREKSVFKPGALELLKKLHYRHIPTIVLSATPKYLLHTALGKLDAEKYFSHGLVSCEDIKYSKLYPEAFYYAVDKLQVSADEVIVFEDAWYSANTAKKAGFSLALIAEKTELRQEEIRQMADFYAEKSWDEFPVDNFF